MDTIITHGINHRKLHPDVNSVAIFVQITASVNSPRRGQASAEAKKPFPEHFFIF